MTDAPTLGSDLKRLEEIVRRLEEQDLDLEAALALFEEGVARLREAQKKLGETEARVLQVVQESSGELRTAPLDG
ncbi:MAG: exodeoxyribonuclease VII small subunit [Gemmatimonadales bacterium]